MGSSASKKAAAKKAAAEKTPVTIAAFAAPKTHVIMINYDRATTKWTFPISSQPGVPNPKHPKIKRGDTLVWASADGDWTISFKTFTPIVNGNGVGIVSISGSSGGAPAGGVVTRAVSQGDQYAYNVSLNLNDSSETVATDPDIIIDSD